MFPNYTFILDTNPERFTRRLISLAQTVLPTSFPAMTGMWFIYDVRSSRELDGSQHVIASGSLPYSRMDEDGAETQHMAVGFDGRGFALVEFTIFPLSDSRIEVGARCGHERLVGPFMGLLEAINERWPSQSLTELLEPEREESKADSEQNAPKLSNTHPARHHARDRTDDEWRKTAGDARGLREGGYKWPALALRFTTTERTLQQWVRWLEEEEGALLTK